MELGRRPSLDMLSHMNQNCRKQSADKGMRRQPQDWWLYWSFYYQRNELMLEGHSGEERNANEITWKVVEKAAVWEFWVWPPQDPTSLKCGVSLLHPNSPVSLSTGRQPHLFPGPARGRHLSLTADCFSERAQLKVERKKKGRKEKREHTKKNQMRKTNLSPGKGLGLQEKAFQCFL